MFPRSKERENQRITSLTLLGFLILTWVSSIESRFVVEKNSLRVTSPDDVKGTYDSAIGNFGIPQYGGSMAGTVIYPKDNKKGCKDFSDFSISFKKKPGQLPTFVLLDRGGYFLCFLNFWLSLLFVVLLLCFRVFDYWVLIFVLIVEIRLLIGLVEVKLKCVDLVIPFCWVKLSCLLLINVLVDNFWATLFGIPYLVWFN